MRFILHHRITDICPLPQPSSSTHQVDTGSSLGQRSSTSFSLILSCFIAEISFNNNINPWLLFRLGLFFSSSVSVFVYVSLQCKGCSGNCYPTVEMLSNHCSKPCITSRKQLRLGSRQPSFTYPNVFL